MASAVRPLGVTRILPTIITDDVGITRAAIDACIEASQTLPGILGIHVEGPFFCRKKNGVHQEDKIRKIESDDWDWIKQLSDIPSILTLAPDQVSPAEVQKIAELGVRVCAGHTNALYNEVVAAHEAGLSGFTHLFNAMRQFSGREPGVVGAALTLKDTWAGLIADGIHVHDASMLHAIESKGYEHIFLVSDAMATIGSDQKTFELYGEQIEEKDGQLVNSEGKLAGSAISLADAVRYCANSLNLPLEKVLAMATRVPATYLKVEASYGTFATGSVADICHLDDQLNVQSVWQDGLK
jgi:N-acetylglucosamine-6-phosphate deacetylase